jgi:hypothetical protein
MSGHTARRQERRQRRQAAAESGSAGREPAPAEGARGELAAFRIEDGQIAEEKLSTSL